MARTALAVQSIVDEGLNPALTAANVDGHSIPGDGETFIEVANGAGAPINVTIVTGGTLDGEAVADKVVAVTNGQRRLIGPFRSRLYNQPSTELVHVDFSSVTSVTCGAFRLG